MRPLVGLALVAIGWTISATVAAAADAPILPIDHGLARHRSEIIKMLSDGQIPADKDKLFNDYFKKYAIPLFVENSTINAAPPTRGSKGDAHAANKKVFQEYFREATGDSRKQLLKLTRESFKAVVAKRLPPATAENVEARARLAAAQANVVLALGELDAAKADVGRPAKPMPEALTDLLRYATPPAAGKATNGLLDALRIDAMIGVERHAESSETPAGSKVKIGSTMLAILGQTKPPAGRDPAVNDWIRSLAATILASLKEPATSGEVAKALDTVINNPQESSRLRCKAAQAMGGLNFPSDSKLDFKPLADHIGHLAVDVCKQQLEHSEQPTIDEPTRIRLKTSVSQSVEGLKALLAATTDPGQKAFVDSVAKRLKKLDDTLDKADLAAARMEDPLKDLESVLQPRGVAPKAPGVPPKGNGIGDETAEVVAGRP